MEPSIEWEKYRWTSAKGTEFEVIREIIMDGYDFIDDWKDEMA